MLRESFRYRSPRRAITLVEVVAGMTLLASLATGVLLAFGAHQKQLRRAELQIEAVKVADQLLGRWYAGAGVPHNRSGRVVFRQQPWVWQVRTVERSGVGSIPVDKVRVEIYRDQNHGQQASATVELLSPVETQSLN